jgi:hypothetical protein
MAEETVIWGSTGERTLSLHVAGYLGEELPPPEYLTSGPRSVLSTSVTSGLFLEAAVRI